MEKTFEINVEDTKLVITFAKGLEFQMKRAKLADNIIAGLLLRLYSKAENGTWYAAQSQYKLFLKFKKENNHMTALEIFPIDFSIEGFKTIKL
jgi:hypothetical protein